MAESSPQRGRTKRVGAVVTAVAVVASAVVVNMLAGQLSCRADVTDDGLYTLSDVSHEAATGLEEPVEVRAFISPNLPAPYHRLEERVEELLREYEAASDGMINYEIIAPEQGGEAAELARGYGVEPVTVGRRTETEQSRRRVYKGIAFVQGPRQETVPDLRAGRRGEAGDFEYEFTRSLLQLRQPDPRRVGIVTGLGGPADRAGFVDRTRRLFDRRYGDLIEPVAVDFGDADEPPEIGDDVSALIAVNIDEDFGREGLKVLDEFRRRGGSLGWFQSGSVVDEQARRRQLRRWNPESTDGPPMAPRRRTDTDLIKYFESLGLRFGADVVIDRNQALSRGAVQTRHGRVQVDHPGLFPISDIARTLPFARHFSTLVVPMPSTITVERGALPDNSEVWEVLKTESSSVRLPEPPEFPVYERLAESDGAEEPGPHTVATAVETNLGATGSEAPDRSRILIVGSGEVISAMPEIGYTGELAALGEELFLGSVEWLARRDELAEIRGKSMPALVADVPDRARRSIQFVNIAVVPALFAAVGAVMLIRRRRRKEAIAEAFSEDDDGATDG